ncbi:hypothetical protein CBR_g53615 [Chara braunii]|uniref:Uncharacterized protein n=1 Tax=Chara braunii TaxID=69332 RepID=A0A388MBB4_CHABU|nr:hypothetical protein CBR_g53615 [Chara braunii]|eukprot:GBG91762.1 hypothetical protein CBR_g53615 [Chara braunii]
MVGTEWDQYDSVFQYDWDFSHLEEAFDEGGALHGQKVYLFGCTEPQLVHYKDKSRVIHIPAVVAVTSPFPPSDKIGIKSIQMEEEMVVPMKEMKMGWAPYVPEEDEFKPIERVKTQIFTLKCTQRRPALKQLKKERIKKSEYCLPYIYQPMKEEEVEVDTVVSILFEVDGGAVPPIICDFDWEFDEMDEFVQDKIDEGALDDKYRKEFANFVPNEVDAAKRKAKEAKEARKKAIEDMTPEMRESRESLENMRFYKFYPKPSEDTPNVENFKASYINRYYGKAHQVF